MCRRLLSAIEFVSSKSRLYLFLYLYHYHVQFSGAQFSRTNFDLHLVIVRIHKELFLCLLPFLGIIHFLSFYLFPDLRLILA